MQTKLFIIISLKMKENCSLKTLEDEKRNILIIKRLLT